MDAKDEIIEQLLEMLDTVAMAGALLPDEEAKLDDLEFDYLQIKQKEEHDNG